MSLACNAIHREETVLPRLSLLSPSSFRHARLRPALRVLPELGHLAGAARSTCRCAADRGVARNVVVRDAIALGARVIVSTYNEPLITSEWAVAVFKAAKARRPRHGFVSTATARRRSFEFLRAVGRSEQGRSQELRRPPLPRARRAHRSRSSTRSVVCTRWGFWLEIVMLADLRVQRFARRAARLSAFIAGVSPDIPWHVTAFHGDYKMTDPHTRPPEMLAYRHRGRSGPRANGLRLHGMRAICQAGLGAPRRTPLRDLWRHAHLAFWIFRSAITESPQRFCPSCVDEGAGAAGTARFERQILRRARFFHAGCTRCSDLIQFFSYFGHLVHNGQIEV